MRASETASMAAGKKPDPTPKELQGLGGAMAPNQPGGSGGQPGGDGKDVWKVPHFGTQDYQVPQPPAARTPSEITKTVAAPANPATAQQMRQAGAAYRITPQEKKGLFGGHLRGSADYGRDHPKTEPTEGTIEGGYYSNPGLQDQLEYDAAKDAPSSTSGTGAPPEGSLYDGDYEEKLKKMRYS